MELKESKRWKTIYLIVCEDDEATLRAVEFFKSRYTVPPNRIFNLYHREIPNTCHIKSGQRLYQFDSNSKLIILGHGDEECIFIGEQSFSGSEFARHLYAQGLRFIGGKIAFKSCLAGKDRFMSDFRRELLYKGQYTEELSGYLNIAFLGHDQDGFPGGYLIGNEEFIRYYTSLGREYKSLPDQRKKVIKTDLTLRSLLML